MSFKLKRITMKKMLFNIVFIFVLKSATPFPKCYLHKEKWTFDS